MTMGGKRIALGADHAGFGLKEKLRTWLVNRGYPVVDKGTNSAESTDYPDYAHSVADSVADGSADLGLLVCGSGIGVCIAANKHQGIRAALAWNAEVASLARQHNNANILCLPARFMEEGVAEEALQAFLEAEFEGGRHGRRVDKIEK